MSFQESAVGMPGVCPIPPGMLRVMYEDPRDHHRETLVDKPNLKAVQEYVGGMLEAQLQSIRVYNWRGEEVRLR